MTVEELIIYGKKHIHKDQTILLLSTLLDINYFDIYFHLQDMVDYDIVEKYKIMIESIKKEVPIQYLLGHTNFYGYDFIINKNVLIPRPETELLVDKLAQYIKNYFDNSVSIADIGTGSGIIAITLKKIFPDSVITAVDISKEALIVAKQNANILNTNIQFIEGNMLDEITDKYDVIVSNPPYIADDGEVNDDVLNNEPHLALFGGKDGLDYYREILSKCSKILNSKSIVAFEIGYDQQNAIFSLIDKYLPDAKKECLKDLNDLDRYIFIFNNYE